MPKCKSCLGSEIKAAILETFPGLNDVLDEIPDCESEVDIEICPNQTRETSEGGHGTGRKKRAPSKYNLFIGNCMKQDKSMKTCAAEYKKQKAGG